MALAEWNSSLDTGIKSIDDQHKKLVEIINDLDEALKLGKGNVVENALYEELSNYILKHFSDEEEYMLKWKYPEMESHLQAHNWFTDKVREFRKQGKPGESSVTDDVLQFLLNWLIEHIKTVDKELGKFLLTSGAK